MSVKGLSIACLLLLTLLHCGTIATDTDDSDDEDETDLGPPDPLPFAEEEVRDDGAVRLTLPEDDADNASNQNACFSPDGSFLIFTRFEEGYNDGPAHIFRLDLDTEELGAPVQLTDGDFDDVNVPYGCFDPETERVVFASDREDANDFWTINPDADNPDLTRLTEHGEEPVWIEPVFSPDGADIAFEQSIDVAGEDDPELAQRASIWRVEVASGEALQLTNADSDLDDRLPSWSPDGETILFQRRLPPSESWDAMLIPAEGGEITNLSDLSEEDERGHDTDLSWSPDGEFVAASTDPNGLELPNIFLLPMAGGDMMRVTSSETNEDGAPCVAPSGLWVAFESHRTDDEDSPSDLWLIRMP